MSHTPVNMKQFISERCVTTYIKNYKSLTNSVNQSSLIISTNHLSFNVSINCSSSYKIKNKKFTSQDNIKCYNYQKMGHILKNCPMSKTGEDKIKKEKV